MRRIRWSTHSVKTEFWRKTPFKDKNLMNFRVSLIYISLQRGLPRVELRDFRVMDHIFEIDTAQAYIS